jgi:hypothetical protein
MNNRFRKFLVSAVFAVVAMMPLFALAEQQSAQAEKQAYHFELVDKTVHAGEKVSVRVKVADLQNKPASNATFDKPKLIMKMPGMDDMLGHAEKLPSDADGSYRFSVHAVAPGDWVLDLTAHVPGTQQPVHGLLPFKVEK